MALCTYTGTALLRSLRVLLAFTVPGTSGVLEDAVLDTVVMLDSEGPEADGKDRSTTSYARRPRATQLRSLLRKAERCPPAASST